MRALLCVIIVIVSSIIVGLHEWHRNLIATVFSSVIMFNFEILQKRELLSWDRQINSQTDGQTYPAEMKEGKISLVWMWFLRKVNTPQRQQPLDDPSLPAAAISSNKTFNVLALSIHSSKYSSSSDRVNWVINIKFPKRFLFTYILFFFSLANFEKHFECYCVCATAYLTASVTVCINGPCKVLRTPVVTTAVVIVIVGNYVAIRMHSMKCTFKCYFDFGIAIDDIAWRQRSFVLLLI